MPLPFLRDILSSFLPSSAAESTIRRIESCPPLARPRGLRWSARLGKNRSPDATLAAARLDFSEALDDVRSQAALDAKSRIAVTRSLRELWHFREEVFSLVACKHDQVEATRRLARLNRHFARAAGRSAMAPLRRDGR